MIRNQVVLLQFPSNPNSRENTTFKTSLAMSSSNTAAQKSTHEDISRAQTVILDLSNTVSQLKQTTTEIQRTLINLQDAVGQEGYISEEGNASSVTGTDTSCITPNLSKLTIAAEDYTSPLTSRLQDPFGGETYVIRDREKRRIITLNDGKLQLEDRVTGRGGIYWICVSNCWFAFRNSVSGAFIGRDGKGKFVCSALSQKSDESFSPRPHPGGGYRLGASQRDVRAMGIGKDGKELVEVDWEDGTAWEFVKA
ncbi:Actin cross-linking protein [Rutstroemia sp. NJR-2017a BVV2]|nr:Actin cross-linking protein [Rutstroemia sp. NJR-2017a BVV2]